MTEHVYEVLCRSDVVGLAAFSWGVSQYIGINKSTLNAPLSTMYNGAITGMLYAIGAGIMTKQYWRLVTITTCAAIGHKQITMFLNDVSSS